MTIKFVENNKNQIINQHPQQQKNTSHNSPSKKLTLQIRMGGGNGLGSLPHNETTASPQRLVIMKSSKGPYRPPPQCPNAPPKEIASFMVGGKINKGPMIRFHNP